MFMAKRTEQAFAYLEKNEHSMMELLKNLVSIETPSADREIGRASCRERV